MKTIQDELPFLLQILTLISEQFGSNCEVVLHDLTNDYNSTIVEIKNGHITNRRVGSCGSNLGLEVLRGSVENGDRFNYVTTLPNGKILRSSSIYIKNEDGKIIGSICINYDITESIKFEDYLKRFNRFETNSQNEVFSSDVNSLLDHLIQEAIKVVDKPISEMTKDDKVSFIGFLDKKGAFLITKSSERISELLNISKFTFYSYLDTSRGMHP